MKHRGGEQNRLEYRSVIEALNPQRTAQPPGEIAPVGHVGLLHLHSLSGTSDIGKQSVAGSFYSGVDEKGEGQTVGQKRSASDRCCLRHFVMLLWSQNRHRRCRQHACSWSVPPATLNTL